MRKSLIEQMEYNYVRLAYLPTIIKYLFFKAKLTLKWE